MPLTIGITGAGISGLTLSIFLRAHNHTVIVAERLSSPTPAGAGIQIPPNASRIFARYDLLDALRAVATEPAAMFLKRYSNGELITRTPDAAVVRRRFGAPNLVAHRADYQRVLLDAAVKAGVDVRFGVGVVGVDAETPTMVTAAGRIDVDLVVGADGVGSTVRKAIATDAVNEPKLSPHRVYHALVPRSAMVSKPRPAELLASGSTMCWVGPNRHVVTYPIRHGEYFNIAMAHVGPAALADWDGQGDPAEMREVYADFDPALRETLSLVDSVRSWKLSELPMLERWCAPNGKVVLLGDAAHAMLPYLAQGAAQAVEDAAVLAACLSRVEDVSDVPRAVAKYEGFRKPRAERVMTAARQSGDSWHLPDGDGQRRRDEALSSQPTAPPSDRNPAPVAQDVGGKAQMARADFQEWLFGYDVVADVYH